MILDVDLAVVGSGFGGALAAMIGRRLGRSVALLERGSHPRFAIGESSTPLANLILEELADRYQLPGVKPLAKFGTWRRKCPHVACGLKRGFTFYHHRPGQPWMPEPARGNELLVAASPNDRIADTHWYRPDFDHHLVVLARALGVQFRDQTQLEGIEFSPDGARLTGRQRAEPVEVRARFVIDATGPRGFLHRALRLADRTFEGMPATQGVYAHFTGVRRWSDEQTATEPPPYPVDDAAVHHVFDGGWIWILRFNNGITSAGAAVTDPLARQLGLVEGETGWKNLLARLPSVERLFESSRISTPFHHTPRLAFRSCQAAGRGWAMLPSAAGFVDPLLSTGFVLNLSGLARLMERLEGAPPEAWPSLDGAEYAEETLVELDRAALLIGALYAHMGDFEVFTALSRLYFAAVSFAEAARRLGAPERAGGWFLLGRHPVFGPNLEDCCRRAWDLAKLVPGELRDAARAELLGGIGRAIEPVDVAGLGRRDRRNWHPALAEDLVEARHKLGASESAIRDMLLRTGFTLGSALKY